MTAEVNIDRHAIDRAVFNRTDGHVTRYFERKGRAIITAAQRNALNYSPLVDPARHTGGLARSIRAELRGGVRDLELAVIADAEYAMGVHEGWTGWTYGVVDAPFLRFFWMRTGKPFKGKQVNHPGGGGNPFLADALHEAFAGDL